MKTLIIYNSIHNNNTEKIAKAMAEELNADIIKSFELKNYDMSEYDLIGMGSGIYFGKHHASIINLVDKLQNIENKRFFIFSTSGMGENVFNNFNKTLKDKINSKKGKVISIFNCLGYDSWGPMKYIGGLNKNRPNENDIEKARAFTSSLKPKVLTLCLTREESMVLLGMKKRGFGEGRWNGFGGKLEKGESIIDAAVREMREESGLRVEELEEKGVINFHFLDNGKILEVHVFDVLKYSGEAIETEEMSPKWFNLDEIPFESMWADDIYWMPLFFRGDKFKGKFVFENNDKLLSHEVEIC
jgi:flavodoxin/ADP-ribose pyrophosphatase YjhB (NUDIX family)